ncbi:hypothetical protein GKQ51_05940 [Azotobacter chroococcum]|uniref:Uncharacterized protein n=1 Tax=Azotobacter chroococcum TaxID=353 RepID=A0AAQ0C110_9GAMM|nr:hypothetical protein GKQ51_05940 [Azotobacter chroococcum]
MEKRFEQQSPTSPIALDGKTLRGSCPNGSAVHLMSAFATQARRMLVQQEVPDKASEITSPAGVDEAGGPAWRGIQHRHHRLPEGKALAAQIVAAKARLRADPEGQPFDTARGGRALVGRARLPGSALLALETIDKTMAPRGALLQPESRDLGDWLEPRAQL